MFLQINNLDSFRKTIIDSIALAQKKQFDSVDYIEKINNFYNSAWDKVAIIFALVGVLAPLLINFIQLRQNEKNKDAVKASLKVELKNEFDEYLKSQITRIEHSSQGVSYQIQSDIFFDKEKFKESFGETVNAMTCYLIGEDYNNFINALDDLLIRFKKITKADVESLANEYSHYYHISALIEKMTKSGDQKYLCHVGRLKKELSSLT